VVTLKEKNLTGNQLTSQNFTDIQLPDGQLVTLIGQALFFNATGVVHAGAIQHLDPFKIGTTSGLFIWVIVAIGGGNNELRIGIPTVKLGHPELADGWPVYAAGQLMMVKGSVIALDNQAGHYSPTGVSAFFIESMFKSAGINAAGKYHELAFP
jgi:hypothetical protein